MAEENSNMVNTIENMNSTFSTPLREANTLPSPPKALPNPVPRCCNNMETISRIETTIIKG